MKIAWREVYEQLLDGFSTGGIGYATKKKIQRISRTLQFNNRDQINYLTDFLTWIEDGNNPMQAAKGVVSGYVGLENKPVQWHVSNAIMDALENGHPIVEGMREWFNEEICALFDSAKNSGSEVILQMLTEYLAQQMLLKQVKDALLNPLKLPLTYAVIAFTGLYLMMTQMLPMFFDIVPLKNWSKLTQNIYAGMVWLQNYWLVLLAIIIGAWFGLKHQLENNTSKYRIKLDEHYPLSLYRNIVAMRLMKFIGILVMMNDNPATAIRRLIGSASKWELYHLEKMMEKLGAGEQNIANVMDTGLLAKAVLFRLGSIANVASDDLKKKAISHAADRSGGEIIKSMKKVTVIATGVMWILVLICMGSAIVQFTSIFSAMQTIR